MGTSRTGTARWKTLRKQALRVAQTTGITNCPTCHTPLNYTQGRLPNSAEPDHILPVSRGGTDTLDNIRILCRRCNQSKGNRTQPNPNNSATTTTTLVAW